MCDKWRFRPFRLRHFHHCPQSCGLSDLPFANFTALPPTGFAIYHLYWFYAPLVLTFTTPRAHWHTEYQFTIYRPLVPNISPFASIFGLSVYHLSFPLCPSWFCRSIDLLVGQLAANPSDWETNWRQMDRPPKRLPPKPTDVRAVFGIPARLVSRGAQFVSAALYSVG